MLLNWGVGDFLRRKQIFFKWFRQHSIFSYSHCRSCLSFCFVSALNLCKHFKGKRKFIYLLFSKQFSPLRLEIFREKTLCENVSIRETRFRFFPWSSSECEATRWEQIFLYIQKKVEKKKRFFFVLISADDIFNGQSWTWSKVNEWKLLSI